LELLWTKTELFLHIDLRLVIPPACGLDWSQWLEHN